MSQDMRQVKHILFSVGINTESVMVEHVSPINIDCAIFMGNVKL